LVDALDLAPGQRIAYRPAVLPRWAEDKLVDANRYRLFEAASSTFSPQEALQAWTDLLGVTVWESLRACSRALGSLRLPSESRAADSGVLAREPAVQRWRKAFERGVWPERVRLLGINGGDIAGFEFRLALALGGKVGVLPASGRAASQILQDEDWKDVAGLTALPDDRFTLQAFLQGVPDASATLGAERRQELARQAHRAHVRERRKALQQPSDGSLNPWETLPPMFARSTLERVDHTPRKLGILGLALEPRSAARTRPARLVLTQEQVDLLAEMEHGRWNAERFLDSWRCAPETDKPNRRHQLLVSWKDLPDSEKQYDRDGVAKLIDSIQDAGLILRPANPATHRLAPVGDGTRRFHIVPRQPAAAEVTGSGACAAPSPPA
jgi:hypothetical protein